jgi:AbrB family looped-hinge helix DNA binding protein
MRTTIDAAGRIVVPKSLRERLGLAGGRAIDIRERDGRIEIEPAPTAMKLVRRGRGKVAVASKALPTLTDKMVRDALEQVRR